MKYPHRLTPTLTLLGNHYMNVYLIEGTHTHTLLEAGISATADLILAQIQAVHGDLSKVKTLIVTHAHADHVTGAAVLKERMPWISVMASPETQRLLSKEKIRQAFLRDDGRIGQYLAELGVVPSGYRPDGLDLAALVDETIRPGQTLNLDGISLEVLDAPGHCPGGIAFWQPETRVLFCSDYLGFHIPPDRFIPNFYVDYDAFRKTFRRLSELDAAWICPGHCGVYDGENGHRYIEGSRAEIQWIHDHITRNHSPEHIEALKASLFKRYYVGEAQMFREENTRYCMGLLVRRILESDATESSRAD